MEKRYNLPRESASWALSCAVPEATQEITEPGPQRLGGCGLPGKQLRGRPLPQGRRLPRVGQVMPAGQERQLRTRLPRGIWKGRLPAQGVAEGGGERCWLQVPPEGGAGARIPLGR